MKPPRTYFAFMGNTVAGMLLGMATQALAASIADSEFATLQQQLKRPGQAVHVAVALTRLTMSDKAGGDPAKVADTLLREQRLYTELGSRAWPHGRWNNGLGIVGLYVDADGLNMLRATASAVAFSGSVPPLVRAHRVSPLFAEVEQAIEVTGEATATVRIRNEQATLRLGADGRHIASGGMSAVVEYATRAGRVLDNLRPEDVPNLAEARAQLAASLVFDS